VGEVHPGGKRSEATDSGLAVSARRVQGETRNQSRQRLYAKTIKKLCQQSSRESTFLRELSLPATYRYLKTIVGDRRMCSSMKTVQSTALRTSIQTSSFCPDIALSRSIGQTSAIHRLIQRSKPIYFRHYHSGGLRGRV
jgi:hypothetical protein